MSNIKETIKQKVHDVMPENRKITEDRRVAANIDYFKLENQEMIRQRIEELRNERDIESTIQAGASAAVMVGLLMSIAGKSKWLLLPLGISALLLLQAVKKYRLPYALPASLRSRSEIAKELYGLEELLANGKYKQLDS